MVCSCPTVLVTLLWQVSSSTVHTSLCCAAELLKCVHMQLLQLLQLLKQCELQSQSSSSIAECATAIDAVCTVYAKAIMM
jgi:hypothetical protein